MDIILLHGDNSYTLRNRLKEILSKYPTLKVSKVDGEDAKNINDLVLDFNVSLFQEKKLLLIQNLFENSSKILLERFQKHITDDTSDNVLVLVESDFVDKRTSLYKLIKTKFKFEEFPKQTSRTLIPWITDYLKESGIKISTDIAFELLGKVGEDQQALKNELDKLVVLDKREISRDDVKTYISTSRESEIFELTEACLNYFVKPSPHDLKEIIHLTEIFKEDYKNYPIFLSILTNQLSQLIRIKVYEDNGYGPDQISKEVQAHPFVIRKLLERAKLLKRDQLEKIFENLLILDSKFKIGELDFLSVVSLLLKR